MSSSDNHEHSVNIWWIFGILLAFTVAEVGMYVTWKESYELAEVGRQAGPYFPKAVMVVILLAVLTIPKAAVVLIYFMHLKFEKPFIVFLAIMPFVVMPLVFSPVLVDSKTLRGNGITVDYTEYQSAHGEHGTDEDSDEEGEDEDF